MQCFPYKEAFSWLTIFLVPVFVSVPVQVGPLGPRELELYCSTHGVNVLVDCNEECAKERGV